MRHLNPGNRAARNAKYVFKCFENSQFWHFTLKSAVFENLAQLPRAVSPKLLHQMA